MAINQTYEQLPERDQFNILMNIESHPGFLPVAKSIVRRYLDYARDKLERASDLPQYLQPFPYTHDNLAERLDGIYQDKASEADRCLDPKTQEHQKFFDYWTKERTRQRLLQYAPFNLTDGAWLQNIARVGTVDRAQALLFAIWADEVGNGKDSENHSNVYRDLLHDVAFYLPDCRSLSFSNDLRFLNSAFSAPVFQLSVAQYSATFFPEIIGMTLWLEWNAPTDLQKWVELLTLHKFDPHFFKLHVGIDNPVHGHGAHVKEVVALHLDDIRRTGGDDAVQQHWQRIWTGYVAFERAGSLDADLGAMFESPPPPEKHVIELISRNAKYASRMHRNKQLTNPKTKEAEKLNDLFKDPKGLLDALVYNNFIVSGKPDESAFFTLLRFNGPMYKVFSEDDIELIREWVFSLNAEQRKSKGEEIEQAPGNAMEQVLDDLRARATGEPQHQRIKLKGPNPQKPDETVEHPVAWWFDQKNALTTQLMDALKSDSRYVVASAPDQSTLVKTYLRPDRTMGQAVGPGNIEVIRKWIAAGCPNPEKPVKVYALSLGRKSEERLRSGMGTVH